VGFDIEPIYHKKSGHRLGENIHNYLPDKGHVFRIYKKPSKLVR
jgi:hypothetical protein